MGATTTNHTGSRQFGKIAVFCGSSIGKNNAFTAPTIALGETMARRGIKLVYGGGNVGLMGVIAETVYNGHGCKDDAVVGVIPDYLADREVSGTLLGESIVVRDMHTRKAKMFELADAFIAIPGGLGTLDETIEIATWQQLGLHTKPVGLLNVNGFFDRFIEFLDHAMDQEFIRPASRGIILQDSDPDALIDKLAAYVAPRSVVELAREGSLDPNVRG